MPPLSWVAALVAVLFWLTAASAAPELGRRGLPADPGVLSSGVSVLCIGDSITDDVGSGSDLHFCEWSRATVTNIADSGDTAQEWEGKIDTEAQALLESGNFDRVHILLGVNDAAAARTKAQYKANLEAIIASIKGYSPTAPRIILSKPGYGAPSYDSTIDEYADAVQEICDADSVVFCGFDLRRLPHDGVYYDVGDPIHPTKAGHAVIRRGFESYLDGQP